ncbi:Diaminopimelate epimerase [Desulfamplus magnetovallimortis]|uniref:Diaminopimelate epimerase n=1 Tax=Desulfamplus magnetovallimortis TaxID=1246637 RepID=A0A1W1HDJ3_9BACT|nr:diaminopimelate epimerase [Desulfamplus magnetovallimortis]SLM30445.1 Diaminopimelate epimerase [Desulfamplus magnetovallimortis]
MIINFEKMEGLGNDFVIIDDRKGAISKDHDQEKNSFYAELAVKLCSRNFGIGADGIILLLESEKEDAGFRIFNSDGSEAQMCGNGMRCFAKYLFEKKIIDKKRFTVETLAGVVIPEVITNESGIVESIRVDMGIPAFEPDQSSFELSVNGQSFHLTAVSMGNPHAVIFVNNLMDTDVELHGRAIENHPKFPEKTNVEFIEMVNPSQMKMRVWERGAGETLACGTGACAALVAACINEKSERKAQIELKGGTLDIEWRASNNHIYKTGPARSVFTGNIEV